MLYPAGSGTRAMPSEPAPVLNHPPRLSSLRIDDPRDLEEARSRVACALKKTAVENTPQEFP